MNDARSEILARIRAASADITEPDPVADVPVSWRYGVGIELDDVVGAFVERVEDYRATIVRVAPTHVATAVAEALVATGARSAVVPPGLDHTWVAAARSGGIDVRVDEPALAHEQLDATDAVVTAASSAIADTGTIVLTHGPDEGRRAITLVPDRHVCVVRSGQVVSDLPESVAAVKPAIAAGRPVTMVSGGSATSDIELQRVEGVHGPRQLYVVVVDE